MTTPEPGDRPAAPRPGADQLERPPSARFRPAAPGGASDGVAGSGRGAVVRSVGVTIGFGLVLAAVAGILAMTSGLVFISGLGGAMIGLVLAGGYGPAGRRTRLAVQLAIGMVLGGAFGTWVIARSEGGVLGAFEYVWTVFGLLTPIQVLLAVVAAAWGARAGPIRWRS